MTHIRLPLFRRAPDKDEVLREDPLGDFLVWWLEFSHKDITAYKRGLSRATRLQKFFTANPMLLVQQLGGGHGRWVIPQKRLGCEYVTDFMIGERSSAGFEWYAVELKSPTAKMFTKAGNPSKELNQAMRQISDWRAWLVRNQPYAARLRIEHGLGLTDINPDLPGLILIGRRNDLDESTNERRRQMMNHMRIQIHSYDWLLDSQRGLSVLPVRTS